MTKKRHLTLLLVLFSIITGAIVGALCWLYLKASNVGITLIWQVIGSHFPWRVYTLIVCLVGGVVIGLYRKKYGAHPDHMGAAVRKFLQERTYPYQDFPIIAVAALLPLLFGGAIGPESGLVCILLCLCVWAREEFALASCVMTEAFEEEPEITGRRALRMALKEMISHPRRIEFKKGEVNWTRSMIVSCGVAAALAGLVIYILFNILMGSAFTLPHIDSGDVFTKDRVAILLLLVIGIGAGYLYLILRKLIGKIFGFLEGKGLQVLNAVLGGLILGIIGGMLPITMFSGGTDLQTVFAGETTLPTLFSGELDFQAFQYEYFSAAPVVLIVIGFLKLFLSNVCIESGWRGGHFFPLLFSGLSIGYGFAGLLGTNEILSIVVVSGALLGTVLQQPLGALALSAIFFPLQELGWMAVASFASGIIPLPEKIRLNPENKGFIHNMLHREERNLISFKRE